MAGIVAQLTGGAVAIFLLASLSAWVLGKISSLEKPFRLAIGFIVSPIVAATVWVYGAGDGDFAYFAQGFVIYSASAFWALIAAVFAGKISRA